ncbi:unnamed protein product [Arabis nemorensis]|uniref:Uncharacterized protein n=1 Tax=Arabis nemorensis TaxID=586526 RepID=A0A565BPH0_9BRAS|nr:unnamed protein product [Arabis nemorensis]
MVLPQEDFTTFDHEGFVNSPQGGAMFKTVTESAGPSQGGVRSQSVDLDDDEIGGESPGLKAVIGNQNASKTQVDQDKPKRIIKKPVRRGCSVCSCCSRSD